MEEISLHILDIAENSLRAGPQNVEILVARDRAQDLLKIDVRDDGKGMDAETLAQVRNPFFTTKESSLGLGLPIVHKIIMSHRGQIEVNNHPGHGVTFIVILPARAEKSGEGR